MPPCLNVVTHAHIARRRGLNEVEQHYFGIRAGPQSLLHASLPQEIFQDVKKGRSPNLGGPHMSLQPSSFFLAKCCVQFLRAQMQFDQVLLRNL